MITMAIAVATIILVLVLRHGQAGLMRLATLELRGMWILALACSLQVALIVGVQPALGLTLATALCIGLFAWWNRRYPGIVLAAAGAMLNFVVMASAGGLMPVSAETVAQLGGMAVSEGGRLLGTKSVIATPPWAGLTILSDWLLLPDGAGRLAAWSIGDLLLLGGIAVVIWQNMKGQAGVPVQ